MKKWWWIGAFFLLADLLSKAAILLWLPSQGIPLLESPSLSFSLDLVFNTGAAWGLFSGHATLLFFVRLGMILFLLGYVRAAMTFPFALLLAGAIGNSLDFLFYGHVVDFLHFCFGTWSFPIFNFADSYITVAILLFFIKKRGMDARSVPS
ncbi:MAG: signal peptidase II [Verrucomicrobiota bacterium]|nr:signal peptidase II [Verrucomicrobiota bacterium]